MRVVREQVLHRRSMLEGVQWHDTVIIYGTISANLPCYPQETDSLRSAVVSMSGGRTLSVGML